MGMDRTHAQMHITLVDSGRRHETIDTMDRHRAARIAYRPRRQRVLGGATDLLTGVNHRVSGFDDTHIGRKPVEGQVS